MLIAYSTLPGYVSIRDHYRGTWFVESLCRVFQQRAKDTDLRDMLDETARELSKYETETGLKQSFNYDVSRKYQTQPIKLVPAFDQDNKYGLHSAYSILLGGMGNLHTKKSYCVFG